MLKITNEIYIDADDNQFTIKNKNIIKDGKNKGQETFVPYGYYVTLEGALRGVEKLLQRRAIKNKEYDIKTIINEIKKIHEDIFNKVG